MSSAYAERGGTAPVNEQIHHEINVLTDSAYRRFVQISKGYVFFNWFFLILVIVEFVIFLTFFASWADSSLLAITLAVIFLTAFSYFVLRLYFQAKKPEQFMQLREGYLNACKELLQYQDGIPEYHLTLVNVICNFVSLLHDKEYSFYQPPEFLEALEPALEKLSCWWHWKDVFRMEELLLFCSIEEHIKLVKCDPINLEYHVALANAYVMLSTLYNDPRRIDDERWISPDKNSREMQHKFRKTAERAIEELKILKENAPNDPWVHVQLAYNYHDLHMPEDEIQEYEEVMRLCPEDKDTLFTLGVLYFQQGLNAKGLRIYEELKRSNYKKAESLIGFYGVYAPYDPVQEE